MSENESESEEQEANDAQAWIIRPIVSLSYPHFRWFWMSNLLVAFGLMVQFTAQGWLVVELTDSALLLGIVEGVWALAFVGSSIPMGVVADRFNRRDLLLADNAVAILAAAAIGVLAITGSVAVWHVMVFAAVGGLLFAVRFPASQAMTARLVPEQHLMNATSLNTAAHSLPNVAGPALGGVLVGGVGIGAAYFATTGAYTLALLMLMLGVTASFGKVERAKGSTVRSDLREAYDYLVNNRDLLKLTAAVLIPFMLGQSYGLLLPLFVEQELGRGAATFGALSASVGAGGVTGALLVATFGQRGQIGRLMFAGVAAVGVAAIVYGLSQSVLLVGAALFLAGVGQSALFSSYETYLLVTLPDEMRGRVMGLTFTMFGFFPISVIGAGALADQIGLRAVAVIEGSGIIVMAAFAWWSVLRFVTDPRSGGGAAEA